MLVLYQQRVGKGRFLEVSIELVTGWRVLVSYQTLFHMPFPLGREDVVQTMNNLVCFLPSLGSAPGARLTLQETLERPSQHQRTHGVDRGLGVGS